MTAVELTICVFQRLALCFSFFVAVNRCQTELQKSVGEPAQSRPLEAMDAKMGLVTQSLHSVNDKLSSMNSKFDTLHMVITSRTSLFPLFQRIY